MSTAFSTPLPATTGPHLRTPYVVGYVRVSSSEQVHGWSMGAQEASIRQYAESQGWSVVEICADPGRSGGSVRGRHGLGRLLELVRGGQVGAILAWREDRLGRQVVVARSLARECARAGCAIITLDPTLSVRMPNADDGANQLSANLQSVIAENERDSIRRRILPGLVAAFSNGRRGGRTPLGYSRLPDGRFMVVEAEAALVRRWFEEVAGGTPVTALVRSLARDQVIGRSGKPYSIDQVRGTLTNPFMIGELHYTAPRGTARAGERQVQVGHHEAIVPRELFLRVQLRLQRPRAANADISHAGPPRNSLRLRESPDLVRQITRPPQHPVHGIAPPGITVCATCGGTMYATLQTRGSRGQRHRVPIYLCRTHKEFGSARCTQGPVMVEAVDPAIHAALVNAHRGGRWRSIVESTPVVGDQTAELVDAEQRLERLTKAIAVSGERASPTLRASHERLASAVASLRERQGWQAHGFQMPPGPVRSCLEDFEAGWAALSPADRRHVVAWACSAIRVGPGQAPTIVFASHQPAVSA